MKRNLSRGTLAAACPRGLSGVEWRRAAISCALAMMLIFSLLIAGCSSSNKKVEDVPGDDNSGEAASEPQPPPTANIEVSYSRPNDSMERVTVSKYFGADVIQAAQTRSGRSASLIRFDGGVPIWEIKADRSLAGRISDIGSSGWAVKMLEYGKVPPHFTQILPDEGPPEPLDRGSFYVFAIERSSGSVSYQAVKVLADGSLQSYAAQPRAGSSFLVCCGLAADFSEPVILPEEISPDDNTQDNSQDNSGSPDQSGGGDSGSGQQP